MWDFRGQKRPDFADQPGPGQESVWDYPRPPIIVADSRLVVVSYKARVIASTQRAVRILETASPPTFYLPAEDVVLAELASIAGNSWCEWKGRARYFSVPGREQPVAWTYENPSSAFADIDGYFSFYPGRVDCLVAGEPVRPQAGGFYGGWITSEIVGPCKGDQGSGHW